LSHLKSGAENDMLETFAVGSKTIETRQETPLHIVILTMKLSSAPKRAALPPLSEFTCPYVCRTRLPDNKVATT